MGARGKKRPTEEKRFLPAIATKTMLAHALGPAFGYPMCDVLAASHAAGVSTACFVARATRSNLQFLQNQVDVCYGEIVHEEDFTPPKLREHLDILLALHNSFATVAAIRDRSSEEYQNMVVNAFSDLPQRLSSPYCTNILRIGELLEDEILWPMITLGDRIEQQAGGGDFGKEIESLLLERVVVHLEEIRKRLLETRKQVVDISERTHGDWESDLKQIARDTGCSRDMT